MVATPSSSYISSEEYLKAEESSSIRPAYRQETIDAMVGASNTHVVISLNLASMLKNHLRGSGCQTYISATKVHIELLDIYYYPDVTVTCDQRDKAFDNFLRYPGLIIEVLSPNTEAFDRGEKFAHYRQIKSLQEYVLVSQNRQSVECFRRNSEGQWVLYPYGQGEELHIASVDLRCAIANVYEDVTVEIHQAAN
ncbi:Uma2 family endonuclease [Anabaena sp. FACHB-709]|uniref:Uma2 family endonuclease n=2 Tax=Nostocaceae TaxID=1162 RepID=A0ABR7ZET5_ANACY|nr:MULTISPECIES: Uma2 family endonuclease [Nostocaceae]BAY69362.1 hypothetical protein NIES23_21560 [Trichormus variabilis NIES-23]HBW32831.1 Uma2 family endonuclease [Nostoc sp. UBA8866]MBD2171166.1 Uma2 family endonuclease [Anabaena cylindrica FACHB-318]MBD2262946.1 Uma2 family endonuclease [Anabaena sp. FACHB-709]MBD2272257.1 Uma2 family endonuclease [Nostoc sp. PCC 7120 = FACHB-418]